MVAKLLLQKYKSDQGNIKPRFSSLELVVLWQPKGKLGGPGDLVIQDRFVANTQGSFKCKIGRLSRHESLGTVMLFSR